MFLQAAGAAGIGASLYRPSLAEKDTAKPRLKLAGEVGITTSSLSSHVSAKPAPGKIDLMDLPKVLREELDIRVIDLNTSTIGSLNEGELDQFRQAAEKAGCRLTNLKMNQPGLDMNSADAEIRGKAMREYKRSIDRASRLGCQWARPLPRAELPDWNRHVAAYQELANYAAERNVEMLVENYGWMESDADSVVKLVKVVGRNISACPDTGNWTTNPIRAEGLQATFPIAVTCDFKAKTLVAGREHPAYNLKECFDWGWNAGFRGPWCLEHAHKNRETLFRELGFLRDELRKWIKGKDENSTP
jgi:hypothetical protein